MYVVLGSRNRGERGPDYFTCTNERNSERVTGFFLKMPLVAEVTTLLPGFLTPRIVMHRCSA